MKRIALVVIVVCLAGGLTAGCSLSTRYQKRGVEVPMRDNQPTLAEFEANTTVAVDIRLDMEARSVEYFSGDDPTKIPAAEMQNAPFMVGIVELNDAGDINPTQYRQVVDEVRTSIENATKQGRQTTLITFVHGWHHSCRTCDNNLTCFRRVLHEVSRDGIRLNRPRNVIGVYVGWRGRQFLGKADVVSIWSRKRVASRVGRRGGKELLNELHEIWWKDPKVTMVTAGHSLGGAFLLSAVRDRLTGNVDDILRDKERTYRVVRAAGRRSAATQKGHKADRARFGDLVILLNPAIEATDYQVFDNDLRDTSRKLSPDMLVPEKLPPDKLAKFSENQLPVLVTIAGEEDTAVGGIFQFARAVQLGLTSRQRKGLGHYEPQVTHTLHFTGTLEKQTERRCSCSAEWGPKQVRPVVELEKRANDLFTHPSGQHASGLLKGAFARPRLVLELTKSRSCESEPGCRGWDPRSPYIVVRADKSVIRDHNDIFNPVIVTFLKEYLIAYENEPGKQLLHAPPPPAPAVAGAK